MKFTKQNLKEAMEVLWQYGNKPVFRDDSFRSFAMDSFDDMAGESDTVADYVTVCLEAWADFCLENDLAAEAEYGKPEEE